MLLIFKRNFLESLEMIPKKKILMLNLTQFTIQPLDLQRLPQHLVFRKVEKTNRPIIAKLKSLVKKHGIFEALRNLQNYNEDRIVHNVPLVYVTKYLPAGFQEQHKRLRPIFKQPKKDKSKTAWRVVTGSIYLPFCG